MCSSELVDIWCTVANTMHKSCQAACRSLTVLDGIPEEHQTHGDDARLHVVVLQLFLHVLLHLMELEEVLVDPGIALHEVPWGQGRGGESEFIF